MISRAASAGFSPPYIECPKSRRMPTLSQFISSIASRVKAAEEKNIRLRGSRGLYSMANLRSGKLVATSRTPSTENFQRSRWLAWKG